MLDYLSVKNIALIENAEIDFENGLNVLTGETGAGKSILLDAIGLLLGARSDKTLVRNGETECKVVGKFSIQNFVQDKFKSFCEKYDLGYDDEILISRSYKIDGKNDIRLNGEPITLSMLKELSSFLVDSYGQNENQIIYDASNQLKILDGFSKIQNFEPYQSYLTCFAELKSINKKLKEFGGNNEERLRNLDILSYQIEEIEKANLSEEDYEQVSEKRHLLLNLGKIVSSTTLSQNFLEDGVISNISRAKSALEQASVYDQKLGELAERLYSASIEISDIFDNIKLYNQNIDFSDEEAKKIDDRIDLYNKMLRKYGKSVSEILENRQQMQAEYERLLNADQEISRLSKEKESILQKLYCFGKQISDYRKENSAVLCEEIAQNLKKLGIKNAKLQFVFNELQNVESGIYFDGMDKAELLFSANLGEELKPLSKIASGGEISRFMLSLKAVIANVDNMPTMIFDEIDTGISGVTSEAIAKLMAKISKTHQVIAVTHSHQIASMADTNFFIEKTEHNGRTITNVHKLDQEEKVGEIARFLSGDNITSQSITNAKQLIQEQENYKNSI